MTDEPSSTWKWHEKHCIDDLGGHLSSIHSANFGTMLEDFIPRTDSTTVFIGLHDYLAEDTWMFTDGTPANYLPWNTGEPNDAGTAEDCAEYYYGTGGSLNDIGCDTVYDTRTLSACTVMTPTRNQRDVTVDQVCSTSLLCLGLA